MEQQQLQHEAAGNDDCDEHEDGEAEKGAARQAGVELRHALAKGGRVHAVLRHNVDAERQLERQQRRQREQQRDKGAVVGRADARVQPGAVVIKARDALPALLRAQAEGERERERRVGRMIGGERERRSRAARAARTMQCLALSST